MEKPQNTLEKCFEEKEKLLWKFALGKMDGG